MAKELPYFKFEPNQWDSGMIQLCSLESKGLFVEMCCLYWSRLGDLPYALALQKLCNGNAGLLEELEKNSIYDVEDDNIIINFLDEQLNEFQQTSEKRAKAANKRWSNASALQMQSKSNAIREDKSKEDKKIPTKDEFIAFALEYDSKKSKEHISAKYDSWVENGWKDGNNNPVKNWKAKIKNTIAYMPKETTVDKKSIQFPGY